MKIEKNGTIIDKILYFKFKLTNKDKKAVKT